ncbi:MAG: alanine racemase [Bacillota bacterium]|jgi:alanine racemase
MLLTEQKQERWIEINLDAIIANIKEIRSHIESSCRLLAVVKADAYGLGSVQIAKALVDEVDMLAVSTCEEGIELRQNGIETPILVFIPPSPYTAELMLRYHLTASIDSTESLDLLIACGANNHPCHLKINSGMNRLGISLAQAAYLAQKITATSALCLTGIYSHLALAADRISANRQIGNFKKALSSIEDLGIDYGVAHIANSTAIIKLPESHLDMVRAGTIIYGQSPVALPNGWHLENPWQANCRIIAVRELKKGDAVGYGGDFIAHKDMQIAIIPFGYADGFALETNTRSGSIGAIFRQSLKNVARIVSQRPLHYAFYDNDNTHLKLPIVGRVGMQLSAVDITGYPIKKDDILQLSLRRTCTNSRISRIYYKDQQIIHQRNMLNLETDITT